VCVKVAATLMLRSVLVSQLTALATVFGTDWQSSNPVPDADM
jgi:hypothetical protein